MEEEAVLRVLMLALCLAATGCSALEPPKVSDGTLLPPSQIQPLAAWVSQATGIPLKMMPAVVASSSALGKADAAARLARAGEVLKGYYVPGAVVISSDQWNPGNPVEVSYLVHELVHHAQYEAGMDGRCAGELERQAYALQNRWLEEHGEVPLNSRDWIDQKSAC